jgi:hypothetical protein
VDDWPYSIKELKSAKSILYRTMSFSDIAKRYSRGVIPVWHADFTHKCICPFHSEGRERTPSLYFSEKTKGFHCFGCSVHGDLFSFLSMSEGRPWPFIVSDFLSGGDIGSEEIDKVESSSFAYIDHSDVCFELSVMLRSYLAPFRDKPVYKKEREWVEWVFARIDIRFANPKALSTEQARSFQMQIDREVYRRKKLMELSIENRDYR